MYLVLDRVRPSIDGIKNYSRCTCTSFLLLKQQHDVQLNNLTAFGKLLKTCVKLRFPSTKSSVRSVTAQEARFGWKLVAELVIVSELDSVAARGAP